MMLGDEALARFLRHDFETMLDIGSGPGKHAEMFERAGKKVTTIDSREQANYRADYVRITPRPFAPIDAIWACHVLEHTTNPGEFLRCMRRDVKPGGVVCITVPPAKWKLVGGHVSIWTEGLLIYQMILAGFDCSEARIGVYGYNVSVLTKVKPITLPPLRNGKGDIETLAKYFPVPFKHGDDSRIGGVRWDET